MRNSTPQIAGARATLILALTGFGVYILNAVVSKVAALSGMSWPLALGDVSQFLLLLASSAGLVASALIREANSNSTGQAKARES